MDVADVQIQDQQVSSSSQTLKDVTDDKTEAEFMFVLRNSGLLASDIKQFLP